MTYINRDLGFMAALELSLPGSKTSAESGQLTSFNHGRRVLSLILSFRLFTILCCILVFISHTRFLLDQQEQADFEGKEGRQEESVSISICFFSFSDLCISFGVPLCICYLLVLQHRSICQEGLV